MARKKIVFVIVEGPSDDSALGVILSRLYDKNTVHVEITHGDITSESTAKPENIASKVGNIVKTYAKANHFKQENFLSVIHIIDTDGAFIPKDHVIEDANAEEPIYTLQEIKTCRPEQIIKRNEKKSEIMLRLSALNSVWVSVPYKAYYMSSNLDHVLYNKLNSSDDEKEDDAYTFAIKYRDDLEGFLCFIIDSDFCKSDDYKESWEFIQKDLHSLERWSNLGICFKEIREERKKENNKSDESSH
ncbi:MAG: hypothetical protein J5959_01325 [Butyrivibrio sp.]|nr:hypothetical protein [Butyrivibrio sp.]